MNGPRESGKNCVDRAVQRRSAGKQRQRIEIALNRPPLLDHRPRKLKLDRPIEPNRIDCNRVEIATELRAGAARKADDACSRNLGTDLFDDPRMRLDAPSLEFPSGKNSRPGIENLHRIDAGIELANQIARRRLDQKLDQFREDFGMSVGEQSRRHLVGRSLSGDHVGRDASTARRRSQGMSRPAANRRLHPRDRLIDRLKRCMIDRCPQCLQCRRIRSAASSRGPSPSTKLTRCPSACGTTRISENRIAASKPKRRIGCNVTSAASFGVKQRSRKPAGLLAQ